mmetsp:Transcript_24131/g.62956  ORF Transcript_24131/g.62956 Transcript_24131/m.62956 type:complete len:225 (-) Transcript_24131:1053-1727(-)
MIWLTWIASVLEMAKSKMWRQPSAVTAANMVDEKGAHVTSPTEALRSNSKRHRGYLWSHTFTPQSAEQLTNTRSWNRFHLRPYTAMPCASYVARNLELYALEHFMILPSSVPARYRWSCAGLKAKQVPENLVASMSSSSASTSASSSSITSRNCSSFLTRVHPRTNESADTEKKLCRLSRSSGCHLTCHTGSVCLPVSAVDLYVGIARLASFVLARLYTATEPS